MSKKGISTRLLSSIGRSWLVVLALCGMVWGCQPTPEGTETLDAGDTPSESDAGGLADAGPEDAGSTTDAGETSDAGLADAGTPPECVVDQDCASNRCVAGSCNPPPQSTSLPPGAMTDIEDSTRFLYTGGNPVQRGVDAGTIEARRVAVIRGQVRARGGAPLADVRVSILSHPEYGYTFTRADGQFDLVINGGGTVTLNYQRADLLPAQRTLVATPWRDYVWAPEVVMVGKDPVATTIDLASISGIAVARGSPSTDASGSRQATLFFPQGTTASRVKADGTTEPLSTITVRATEYTVGADGPKSMPAELPPTSAYTYAVELSVDELGPDEEVRFSQPVAVYVENFLGFPVGSIVPAGFYDRKNAAWLASDNGRVISILSKTGGLAELDIAGQGTAATEAELTALGIGEAERVRLATLYSVGTSLWRTPTLHFTPWDYNWPYGPPLECPAPPPSPEPPPKEDECEQKGSIIGCQSQVLGEAFPIEGTRYQLRYSSRWLGAPAVPVVISDSSLPSTVKRIEVELTYAGHRIFETFDPAPNLTKAYRLAPTDAYGRKLSGPVPVRVVISYVYQALYLQPAGQARAFAAMSQAARSGGAAYSRDTERLEIRQTRVLQPKVRFQADNLASLGGLRLDVHHALTSDGTVLSMGDGTERTMKDVLVTYAGNGSRRGGDGEVATNAGFNVVNGAAFGPDGSMYVADSWSALVRRIDGATQVVSTFAGSIEYGGSSYGDNGPAVQAGLEVPNAVTVAPDGSVYIADRYRVRKVDPSGIITTAAGGGTVKVLNSPVPATQASFGFLMGIVAAPDGTVFISDGNDGRIYRLDRDGMLTRIAGSTHGFSGDNGPAINAQLSAPWHLTLDKDGALFVADNGNNRIRRIGPDGVIRTVAGNGTWASQGDGAAAVDGSLEGPSGVAVRPDGSLLISEANRIREVTRDGILRTYAGNGLSGTPVEGAPAISQPLVSPGFVTLSPRGVASFGDNYYFVRQVKETRPRLNAAGEMLVPQGQEVFVFNAQGRHLRTVDGLDGRVLLSFEYTAEGRLAGVRDAQNRLTRIERDADGKPTAIVAPGGERTTLATGASGRLSRITHPNGTSEALSYDAEGLLSELTDAAGGKHLFSYDVMGRLTRDEGPGGFVKTLTRTDTPQGYDVTVSTGLGVATTYRTVQLGTGDSQRILIGLGGVQREMISRLDGTTISTQADGTITTTISGADPVWGMLSPMPKSIRITSPGGQQSTTTFARTVTLADPSNPFSITRSVDTVTRDGKAVSITYDAATRTRTLVSATGQQVTRTFDAQGRELSLDVGGGFSSTTRAYDAEGRLSQVARGALVQDFAYAPNGRLASVTTPSGAPTSFGYNAAGQLTSMTLPGGAALAVGYDAAGHLTRLEAPGGRVHTLEVDATGGLAKHVAPGGGQTLLSRDADGRVREVTLPSARKTQLAYDSAGRLSTVTSPEATTRLTYDGIHSSATQATWTPSSGSAQSLTWGFDGALVTRLTFAGAANGTYDFDYANLQPTGLRLDNGPVTTIARDADGQEIGRGPFTFTRNGPLGAISQVDTNGMAATVGFDALGRVQSRALTVGGTQKYSLALTYEASGRVASRTESVDGVTQTESFGYDAAGQLVSVQRDGAAAESYTFDVNGNRLSRSATGQPDESATYDLQDRVVSSGGNAYGYNADGQLASRGSDSFSYSTAGQLLSATVGGKQVSYSYDAFGRRVARTEGATKTEYLYADKSTRITHTRSAGVLTEYLYDDAGLLFALRRGTELYFVATDQVGSPRVVTDATGAVIKTLTYDGFGRVRAVGGSEPLFELAVGFAGGIPDEVTGLVRFGLRDYDPETGRWTTLDPLLFGGGDANLYRYVGNNPIAFRDPTGTSALCDALQRIADDISQHDMSPFEYGWHVLGPLFTRSGAPNDNAGADANNVKDFDGVDMQYVSFAYSLSSLHGGGVFGATMGWMDSAAWVAIRAVWQWAQGASAKAALNNAAANMAGVNLGALASLYSNFQAFVDDYCDDEKCKK